MKTRKSGNDQQLHTQSTAQQTENPNQDSGNSPPSTSPKTTQSQQGASSPPPPDTTPTRLCTRFGCENPITGRTRLYCSKACSAATRNRRYYLTLQGRLKKRAGASRYFQNHHEELYEKRRARMDQYVVEIVRKGEVDFVDGRISSPRLGLEDEQYTQFAARNLARMQHDWQPNPYDGRVGKPMYFFTQDGRAVLMDHYASVSPEQTLAWRAMRDEIMSKWRNGQAVVQSSQSAQKTEVSNG